jgi:hypothetical protein
VEAFCLPTPLDILLWRHRNSSGSKKSRQWHSGLAEAISANALNAFRQETIRYDFRK